MDITITTGIYSLDKIAKDANAAARQGVPLAVANKYPLHSIAHVAFSNSYQAACEDLELIA